MPGRAAGFRAKPSAAAAVALACASPQTADAIAMENPAVMATQLVPPAISPPCANMGTAKLRNDIAINILLSSFIVSSPCMNCRRRWLTSSSYRRPHTERRTSKIASSSGLLASGLVLFRHSSCEIDGGQQDKNVG